MNKPKYVYFAAAFIFMVGCTNTKLQLPKQTLSVSTGLTINRNSVVTGSGTGAVSLTPTSPQIYVGGVASNCRTGHHGVDGINVDCGSYPNSNAFNTIPGEVIEIYGANLRPVGGESLNIVFRQWIEESSANMQTIASTSPSVLYLGDGQINVITPSGLRSGPVFVSLFYGNRGESNADPINIIGPLIAGDGIVATNILVRDDLYSGETVAMYGNFSSNVRPKVFLRCNRASTRTEAALTYFDQNQINFTIPSGLADLSRCAVTVNSSNIESPPHYIVLNARSMYTSNSGIYHWETNYNPNPTGGQSNLKVLSEDVVSTGFQTLRLAVMPGMNCNNSNTYFFTPIGACVPALSLKQLAQRSDFNDIFRNPAIKTYFLTSFSLTTGQTNWTDSSTWTTSNKAIEAQEMQEYADYLGSQFPTKNFVIMNWEGDNAIYEYMMSLSHLDQMSDDSVNALFNRYADWINTRAQAVHNAGRSNVKLGIEFNYSWRAIMNENTKVIGPDCTSRNVNQYVITSILPKVRANIDYISFSSYDTINSPAYGNLVEENGACTSTETIAYSGGIQNNLGRNLRLLIDFVRVNYPEKPLIIGEYGFHDEQFNSIPIEGHMGGDGVTVASERVVNTALHAGAAFTIAFQYYDVPEDYVAGGYGLSTEQGIPKFQGQLRNFYQRGVFAKSN